MVNTVTRSRLAVYSPNYSPVYHERAKNLPFKNALPWAGLSEPNCTLFSFVDSGWRMGRSGRSMVLQNHTKTLASGLVRLECRVQVHELSQVAIGNNRWYGLVTQSWVFFYSKIFLFYTIFHLIIFYLFPHFLDLSFLLSLDSSVTWRPKSERVGAAVIFLTNELNRNVWRKH